MAAEYVVQIHNPDNPHLTHDPITRPDTPTACRDDEHDR